LDSLKRVQGEKVRVACYNMGCVPTYRKFKKFVILRVTAGSYLYIHIDPFSFAGQARHESSDAFLIDVSPELLSAQNFIQFSKYCKGKKDSPLSERAIKSMARL